MSDASGHASRVAEAVAARMRGAIERVAPFRATVAAESAGLVQIKRLGQTSADTELYARIPGLELATDDEVLILLVNGVPVVVGKIQRAAPSFYRQLVPLRIRKSAAPAFLAEKDDGTDIFYLDTLSATARVWILNGSSLRGASDDGATQTWEINSATGGADFRSLNTPIHRKKHDNIGADLTESDTTSGAATTVVSDTFTLPAGTWTLKVEGSCAMRSSVGQKAKIELVIDGTTTTFTTEAISDYGPPGHETYRVAAEKTGVASGSRTCSVRVYNDTAGTLKIVNGYLDIWAERTA